MNTFKPLSQLAALAALGTVLATGPVYAQEADSRDSQLQQMSAESQRLFHNGWTEGKIETAILFNPNLNNFTIDVDVHDKIAKLSGSVSSDVEKDLAEQIALSVDGIDDVDNQLSVKANAQTKKADDKDSTFLAAVEDASISAKVKMQLLANSNVDGMDINVDTKNKVVTLKGEVNSDAVKDLAEKIARNVDNVKSVKNDLDVMNS